MENTNTSRQTPRKGARRMADIAPETLTALSRGDIATATLIEGLALDQALLLRSALPDVPDGLMSRAEALGREGILKRMQGMALIALDACGPQALEVCRQHRSDTVRGWACFMVTALHAGQNPTNVAAALQTMRPLADDAHFGVREWAWLALRPLLTTDLEASIDALQPWTGAASENLRRFTSEALRPRGVWCAHIEALKREPARGLPLLEPLRADASRYVQDSVANWLNDAAKTQPNWVRALCARWRRESPCSATERICQRGLRSV